MLQKILDAHLERGRRARAARARALHVQVDHAIPEVLEDDIAAVLRHRRTNARIEKFLDLSDDFIVVGRRGMRFGGIGDRTCQSRSADLVTVTKSEPKNTRSTPSTANSLFARGEGPAVSAVAKSIVPFSMTTRPGRNFRVEGFGVCSVWMNKPTSCRTRRGYPLGVA